MPKKQQQQAESRQWQWEQRLANSWQKQQQDDRPSQNGQRIHQGEQRGVWQQHRAHSWQNEHHNWHERGGYNGYHIPENHFHDYFGRDHRFRIHNLPLVIFNGYPCFQYEGYWFGLVDPWPENWSYDWFENDDVYIEYSDDGYYLYNRRHPDIGIAISVFMN